MSSVRFQSDRGGRPSRTTSFLFAVFLLLCSIGTWVFLREDGSASEPEESAVIPPATEILEPSPPSSLDALEFDRDPTAQSDPASHGLVARKTPRTDLQFKTSYPDMFQLPPELQPDAVTVPFNGRALDRETQQPIVHYWMFLIPTDRGDVLEASKTWPRKVFRASDGRFHIERLIPGVYNILVQSGTHEDWVKKAVSIPDSGTLLVDMTRGTYIDGTVRDEFGQVLPGMEVALLFSKIDEGHQPPQRRLTTTNDYGQYEFCKLPPGLYSVCVGLRGDVQQTTPEFYLGRGEHSEKSFSLERLATVRVTVLNHGQREIPRARVSLAPLEGGASTRWNFTDIKGEARLHFIRSGRYKLCISSPGFQPLEEEIYVGNDDIVELNRTLALAPK